jgi:hypothetical protein
VIDFLKDEGINLETVATLWSIVNYEPLRFLCVYGVLCFGHVMFKTCQYATNDDKNFMSLILVYVKDVQIGL